MEGMVGEGEGCKVMRRGRSCGWEEGHIRRDEGERPLFGEGGRLVPVAVGVRR